MARVRCILSWLLFLGFLTGVGAVCFVFVRHAPRCTITGALIYQHLSADGSRLVTLRPKANHVQGPLQGPLRVWDTHSGHMVHEWFADADVLRFNCSADDRHGAIVLGDGRGRIVDWQTGQAWRFDEPPENEAVNRADFSPRGRWLFVVTASCSTLYLIDVDKCEVVLRMKDNWPVVSPDDRLLFYRQGSDRAVTVRDIGNGNMLGMLATTANQFFLSDDGRLLIERHQEPIPAPRQEFEDGPGMGVRKIEEGFRASVLAKDFRVSVWDTETFQRRFQHKLARAGYLETSLSRDGRRLAMWLRGADDASNLEMIDTATGALLWSHTMQRGGNVVFAPDGSLCYFVRELDEKKSIVTMFDAASGQVLWEKPALGSTYFAMNGDILLYQEDFAKPMHFLDARTGAVQATIPLNFRTANYIPVLTHDGRHFVIGGWQMRNREPYFWETWLEKYWPDLFGDDIDGALVMETATGRELFRVVNRAKDSYALSDDGSTLVTVDAAPGPDKSVIIRIWDIPPTRAQRWAVGVTAATGVGLLALRWAWRRRKARKPATPEASVPRL
jgi:WD40 repeat protein